MRFNRLIAPAMMALSLVACSKDDDPTGPNEVDERIAASEALATLATKTTNANAKVAIDVAHRALDLGAPISTITLTTGTASIARDAVLNARVAADIGGGAESWKATALQLVVQNSSTTAANGTYNVVVMWQGTTDLVFVGMPSSVSSADISTSGAGAFGGLFTYPNASWQATSGSASISGSGNDLACPNFPVVPGIGCKQASFTGAFSITHSTPYTGGGTNTATGDKTASLASRELAGFRMTVNCAETASHC